VRTKRRLPTEALAPYLLDVPNPRKLPPDSPRLAKAPAFDFFAVFGNHHPVAIEIGFGKGLFLQTQGQACPDANFLGIEIERKYVLLTATRLAKAGLTNVKVACTDARWFLRERIAPESVAAIHVYFPDPWWKTRHRKRKLLDRDFVELCVRVLCAGGAFYLKTDVADYFAESIEMLNDVPGLRSEPTGADENSATNFERKYRKEGRAIYRAVYVKKTVNDSAMTTV